MPTRLTALDAFRGAVILFMVLVNNGGGPISYIQLEHSPWHGWTLTDTVFPSFLWIVGLAITLSRGKLFTQILRRAALLFTIGFLLYFMADFNLSHARILGVLQRIAICYFIAACLYQYTAIRTQIAALAGVMLLYSALMYLYPVPHYGPGQWGIEGNFAHYIDNLVLGPHNYARTKTWDPEGVVSTLPAIATALFGVMAGHILKRSSPLSQRIRQLVFAGALLIPAALLTSLWMPINKKLWTCSFVLLMAGIDYLALAALLWLIDLKGHKTVVKPLLIVGMNSIAVYVASEVMQGLLDTIKVGAHSIHELIYNRYYAPVASPENASLLWALTITACMYALAYVMYKRKWFWRI